MAVTNGVFVEIAAAPPIMFLCSLNLGKVSFLTLTKMQLLCWISEQCKQSLHVMTLLIQKVAKKLSQSFMQKHKEMEALAGDFMELMS